ncbi:hypothetical protein BCR44DRAFT_53016 [Catenaria anguillulae PL171]|uniref:Uncharacterized protein n=1 Tax=Catenaria anguillulae PL171 TaxID=765915 RepID=A0A1Y2I0W1_9FUNG|nr:hypothetical protein BCR44DRAFT_53016 [Catenaria anguillulae PL171]
MDPSTPLNPTQASDKRVKRLFLYLLRARAFPTDWSPLETQFPELCGVPVAQTPAHFPSFNHQPGFETRQLLALATLTCLPDTLDVVFRLPVDRSWVSILQSLIRSYALYSRVCPPAFVAHVLERTEPEIEFLHFALMLVAPCKVLASSSQEYSRGIAIVDVLYEHLGSAGRVRQVLASLNNFIGTSLDKRSVMWRGMWWWLKMASKRDDWEAWNHMCAWIDIELRDAVQRGEDNLYEDYDKVWLAELQALWEEKMAKKKGRKKRKGRKQNKCIVQ